MTSLREHTTYTYRLPASWIVPIYNDDRSAMSEDESDRFDNTLRVIRKEIGAWDCVDPYDDYDEFGRYDMPAQIGVQHGPVRTFAFIIYEKEGADV